MTDTVNTRRLALDVLLEVTEHGAYSNQVLRAVLEKNVHAIYFYQRENFLIQAEETDEDTNEKEYVMRWGK